MYDSFPFLKYNNFIVIFYSVNKQKKYIVNQYKNSGDMFRLIEPSSGQIQNKTVWDPIMCALTECTSTVFLYVA